MSALTQIKKKKKEKKKKLKVIVIMSSINYLPDSTVLLPSCETGPDEQCGVGSPQVVPTTLPDLSKLNLVNIVLRCGLPQVHIRPDENSNHNSQESKGNPDKSGISHRPHSLGQGSFCDVTTHFTTKLEAKNVPGIEYGDLVAWKRYQIPTETPQNLAECVREIRREFSILLHPTLRAHRNIAKLIYIGWQDISLLPVLSFRLAEYGNLEDFLSAAASGSVGDSERTLLTRDIASGLQALHNHSFVHRDLKLSNVLVTTCPVNKIKAVLTDFSGSIQHLPAQPTADKGHYTPQWAAPEEIMEEKIEDYRRCDVYSFGLVIATLWIGDYVTPGLSIPCFLSTHIIRSDVRTTSDHIESLKVIKCLSDDEEESPLCLAWSKLSSKSLAGRVLEMTLRRQPMKRAPMDLVLAQLGVPEEREQSPVCQQPGSWIQGNETMGLLSGLRQFRDRTLSLQTMVFDELVRVMEELITTSIMDAHHTPHLPAMLPQDINAFWSLINGIDNSVRTQPLGGVTNMTFASLALDLALFHFYGLGTTVDEENGLKWLDVSASLGNYKAMAMITPFALSSDARCPITASKRTYLLLTSLKGYRRSIYYLRQQYPQDFSALQKLAILEPHDDVEIPEEIPNEILSGLQRLDVGNLRKASTPDQLAHLALHFIRFIKGYGEFRPLNSIESSVDTLAWASIPINFRFELPQPTSSYADWSGLAYFYLSLFGRDEYGLECAIDCVKNQNSEKPETIKKIYTRMLHVLVMAIVLPDMALSYRWSFGSKYKTQAVAMIQLVVKAGGDPFVDDESGQCPFLSALLANNIAVIEAMVQQNGQLRSDLSQKIDGLSRDYGTPMSRLCVMHSRDRVLDWLLSRGVCAVDEVGADGISILNLAAGLGNVAIIKVLVKHGANLFEINDPDGLTPFTRCLVQGHLPKVAELLLPDSVAGKRRIFHTLSKRGFTSFGTVLSVALSEMSGFIAFDTIQFMRNAGAIDFMVRPNKKVSVFGVFYGGLPFGGVRRDLSSFNSRTFALLLEMFHGREQINIRMSEAGFTPLHLAVWRGDRKAVELLLQYDELDVNATVGSSECSVTAFDLAADRKTELPRYVKAGGAREIRSLLQSTDEILSLLRKYGGKPAERSDLVFGLNSLREELKSMKTPFMLFADRVSPGNLESYNMDRVLKRAVTPEILQYPEVLDHYRGSWPRTWSQSDHLGG